MKIQSKIIGILGAGQLARMSAQAAQKLGHKVIIFSETDNTEPACEFAQEIIIGKFNDIAKLRELAKKCDVITLENEFIDSEVLYEIQKINPVYPTASTFELIADKLTEKQTFEEAGIPVVPYRQIRNTQDLANFASERGFPFVLKSAKGGYDGYGNHTIYSKDDFEKAFSKLKGNDNQLIAEAFIELKQEVAVQVVASKNEVKTYPICETIQKNHICDEVISPAELEKSIAKLINNYAQKATKAIKGIGIFAYEFFIDKNNNVYLNESAPRPHNSAHYTIEGCQTSQFENHIRAVTNDKLGKTTLKVRYAVMKNILGTQNGASQFVLKLPNKDNIFIHLYGKKQSRVGRKMGHLTITGDNLEELQKMAREYQGAITI